MQEKTKSEILSEIPISLILRLTNAWNVGIINLLNRLIRQIGPVSVDGTDHSRVQVALVPQIMRMGRYLRALSRLSYPIAEAEDAPWTHLVDGAHAIHKSLFEVFVEFALCITYSDVFGDDKNTDSLPLVRRLTTFSTAAKDRKNHQRLYAKEKYAALASRLGEAQRLPPSVKEFFEASASDVAEALAQRAASLQGENARFTQLNHWFPEKSPDGLYFTHRKDDDGAKRPKDAGSMAWRCKAILALHYPDESLREFWWHSYEEYYELLNIYSHPVLGYDDNFRPESERLLDLADQQIAIRHLFHKCVLKNI